MQYIFYYKEKSRVEHISLIINDDNDEDNSRYIKIGSINNLIEYINYTCNSLIEVIFEQFSEETIEMILNSISINKDIIPTENENTFWITPKIKKVRRRVNDEMD